MYIEISNLGVLSEANTEVKSFLSEFRYVYSNFLGLIRSRECCPLVSERFLNKFLINKVETVTYKYQTKKGIIWIEWIVCKVSDVKLVAIGKDVTCVKKFEPLINEQNRKLKQQNKNMIDSLKYAEGIQKSLLPNVSSLQLLKNSFIIYQPKDIVSGDFYWFYQMDDFLFIASIDCTGHGVPGALMTVLSNTLLNEIIIHEKVSDPKEILALLDVKMLEALKVHNRVITDGLDIGLCRLNTVSKELIFSGAFHNAIVFQDGVLNKIRGGRFPIGFYPFVKKEFKNELISLKEGDRFYLFSDGYQDQFGGFKNKKIGSNKVVSLIQEFQSLNLQQQKKSFKKYFEVWKSKSEQIDDVLFMGFEI